MTPKPDLDVIGVATTVPDETLLPSPPPPENAHTAPAGGSSSEVRRG